MKFLKPNKWNVSFTVLYTIFSWIPMFRVEIRCIVPPCPPQHYPLVFLFGAGGLWTWLLTVIILYFLVSFIVSKMKK